MLLLKIRIENVKWTQMIQELVIVKQMKKILSIPHVAEIIKKEDVSDDFTKEHRLTLLDL